MYFKEEYNEYYNALAINDSTLKSAVIGLQDSITEVSNQFNSVFLLLGDMKGEFSIELSSGVNSLLEEISGMKKIVDSELTVAVDHMTSLGEKLVELKPDDEELEKKQDSYNQEARRSVTRYEFDENGIRKETDSYKNWLYNLTSIKKSLEELTLICKELQKGCDNDIALIEKFNSSVVDLRLKLVAVSTAAGNSKIEDISNMSLEEKQKYLDKLISDITDKYNEYKKLYEYYSKQYIDENCTKDELYNFTDFYSELLRDIPGTPKVHDAFDSKNPVTRGNSIVDIIDLLTNTDKGYKGKSILDIIKAYSDGVSWEESGMDEIYRRNTSTSLIDALRKTDSAEELFWSRLTYGDKEYNEEIINDFLNVVKVLDESKKGFLNNYNNALGSAMVIKGMKGLNECLTYDYTYKTGDLENYTPNKEALFKEGFNTVNYTLDEEKMLSYLLETRGADAAREYENVRKDAIYRRNGQIKAEEYYESLHSGDNQGIDAVLDHISVGAKGFGDGIGTFADGLIDIIAPDSQMSTEEYETMFFLRKLEESEDSYDKSLLTDYRITNTVGVYTIPTVVNACTGGSVGTALFITSDIGNGVEARQQQSRAEALSYDSLVLEEKSYSEALFNCAATYVGTDIPNDVTAAVIDIFADVNPIAGAALDFAFDTIYKNSSL